MSIVDAAKRYLAIKDTSYVRRCVLECCLSWPEFTQVIDGTFFIGTVSYDIFTAIRTCADKEERLTIERLWEVCRDEPFNRDKFIANLLRGEHIENALWFLIPENGMSREDSWYAYVDELYMRCGDAS